MREFNFLSSQLKPSRAIIIFIILGFIIFGNALFNGFVIDDYAFIISNPDVHSLNIPHLFSGNMFNSVGYYRPIPALYFALLYSMFGSQAFFYHFLQISLHILNTVLLYFTLRTLLGIHNTKDAIEAKEKEWNSLSNSQKVKYMKMLRSDVKAAPSLNSKSNMLSLFLSLIFLVHPMNVESVSYIASSQSELFFLFGILALLVSLKKHISLQHLFLISGLSLLSLLTKETGFLFLLLIICFQFLFNRKEKLKTFLFELASLFIYFFFRFAIGKVSFTKFISHRPVPVVGLSFLERLANIPAIVLYYLTNTFFPVRLAVWQLWVIKRVSVQKFYLPLFLDSVFFIAICLEGVYIYRHKRDYFKIYLFFFLWFLSGIGMILQIFPLDMTVADRWFYFPLVGLLGMLGVGIQSLISLPNKQGISLVKHEIVVKAAAVFGLMVILLFSLRTIVRNANFHDQMTLYVHDAQIEDNYAIEDSLGAMYNQEKNLQEAYSHLQKSVSLYPNADNLFHLGNVYESMGNLQKAQEYYYKALNTIDFYYSTVDTNNRKESDLDIYTRLIEVLIQTNAYDAAEKVSREGIQYYPNSGILWMDLTLSEYKLHHWQEALAAAQKAKILAPGDRVNLLYTASQLKLDLPLDALPPMPYIFKQ